jgi:hypothetical protein
MLSPAYEIKRQIVIDAMVWHNDAAAVAAKALPMTTEREIDAALMAFGEPLVHGDDEWNEARNSGEPTDLPDHDGSSRNYESFEVGRILDSGAAVGWTFWHGGGKHSEPNQINWVDSAYFLKAREETRVVKVWSVAVAEEDATP